LYSPKDLLRQKPTGKGKPVKHFVERFGKLKAELNEQMKEEGRLNDLIRKNLAKLELKE